MDLTRLVSVDNETLCISTFAPKDLEDQGMDFILGDSFLRNVYALFDYGNWTDPWTRTTTMVSGAGLSVAQGTSTPQGGS